MEVKVLWKVMISRPDGDTPEGEAWDSRLDAIADACSDLVDCGSGFGFGRRFLDYTFASCASAKQVMEAAEVADGIRDIEVQIAEIEADLDC